MASEGQRYHDRVVRIFRGEFGEDIYSSAILAGPRQRETISLKAYVSLWADREFRFISVVPTRLTLMSSLQRVKRFRMSDEDIATQYTQVKHLRPGGNPAALDDLLWTLAESRTAPLDLPTALVTFMSNTEGTQKVVFWYPRLVPGEWMLRQMQQRIA